MNETMKTILNHASIRQFTDQDVPEEVIEQLARAGQQAPFTGQMYACIYTKDLAKRQELTKYYGQLPLKGPVFMLFCLDFRKLEKFIADKGRHNTANDTMMMFLGVQDVAYFAQNMVLAAESLGLGTVFLGAAPNYALEMSDMFNLPERVYPVVGMVLGYPAEQPKPRPRIPTKYVLFKDEYKDLSGDDVKEALGVMDAGLIREGYYSRLNAKIPKPEAGDDEVTYESYGWGEHMSRKYARRPSSPKINEDLRAKGINI